MECNGCGKIINKRDAKSFIELGAIWTLFLCARCCEGIVEKMKAKGML